jgi:hypothetical protein
MLEFIVVGIALLAICGLFAFALHIDPVSGRWLGRAGKVNYLVRLTEWFDAALHTRVIPLLAVIHAAWLRGN